MPTRCFQRAGRPVVRGRLQARVDFQRGRPSIRLHQEVQETPTENGREFLVCSAVALSDGAGFTV